MTAILLRFTFDLAKEKVLRAAWHLGEPKSTLKRRNPSPPSGIRVQSSPASHFLSSPSTLSCYSFRLAYQPPTSIRRSLIGEGKSVPLFEGRKGPRIHTKVPKRGRTSGSGMWNESCRKESQQAWLSSVYFWLFSWGKACSVDQKRRTNTHTQSLEVCVPFRRLLVVSAHAAPPSLADIFKVRSFGECSFGAILCIFPPKLFCAFCAVPIFQDNI